MNNNFRQVYEKMVNSAKLKNEIHQAKSKFETKPFVLEYWKLKTFVVYFSPLLSLFSIITAFGFLYYQLADNLHFVVAGGLALVLLLVLELLKIELSSLFFKRIFQNFNIGSTYGLGLITLLLFALSVFTSVNGAREIFNRFEYSIQKLETMQAMQKDSLYRFYEQKIQNEKQALNDFKNSVSWNGKINISDKTVAQTQLSYTAKIDSLENEKRTQLLHLLKTSKNDLATIQIKNEFNVGFWLSISGLIEILIIVSSWFRNWYIYNVCQESELLTQLPSLTIDWPTFQQLTAYINLQRPQSIGFNGQNDQTWGTMNDWLKALEISNKNQENPTTSIAMNQNKSEAKKEKDYSGLIQDVKRGIRDMRYLTHTHRVNVPTVKKIFNQYSKNNQEKQ
jgi:hypothetical protein